MSNVLGVIVIARNGDRREFFQNPNTYAPGETETTPLGEAESHALGKFLRSVYLNSNSPSFIKGISTDLIDNSQVHVRVKAGGEGTVTFDSATALLQGLYPPNMDNKIELANGQIVVAPLDGYQYIPVETVEPGNDRSLEPWTSCPNFEKHIQEFYSSPEYKEVADAAKPFLSGIRDYVFGRPTTLDNIWNIYDYVNSELEHNRTYAYRLPPSFIEQARGFVDFHEDGVFSDTDPGGIGNIAGRTILSSILAALERIAFNDDPLQFLLLETSYQPFISLFHQTELVDKYPELKAIPDFGSALVIELRRGDAPDLRDFLRFQWRNGTQGAFEEIQVFGHYGDIPVTEFIYRTEDYAITSNKQWARVCGASTTGNSLPLLGFGDKLNNSDDGFDLLFMAIAAVIAFFLLFGAFFVGKFIRTRQKARYVQLPEDEIVHAHSSTQVTEKRRLI